MLHTTITFTLPLSNTQWFLHHWNLPFLLQRMDMVKVLLKHGADIFITPSFNSPSVNIRCTLNKVLMLMFGVRLHRATALAWIDTVNKIMIVGKYLISLL